MIYKNYNTEEPANIRRMSFESMHCDNNVCRINFMHTVVRCGIVGTTPRTHFSSPPYAKMLNA